MRKGDVIVGDVNYGQLRDIEIDEGVWCLIDDFKSSLVPHTKRLDFGDRLCGGHLFTDLKVTIDHGTSMTSVFVSGREEIERVARKLSTIFPDVRVEGSARIFQFYKDGEPFGDRKKFSDFYIATPEEEEKYSW